MICNKIVCHKCKKIFDVQWKWDESGYGYSAKYVICPRCGAVQIDEIIEDLGLDVNHDERYYMYN